MAAVGADMGCQHARGRGTTAQLMDEFGGWAVGTPSRIVLERGYHAANKRFYTGGNCDSRLVVSGVIHSKPRAYGAPTQDPADTGIASRLSLRQIPSVDYQFCARDEAGFVTRKKEAPVCKLLRLRHTLKWRGSDHRVADAFWLLVQHHRSRNDTWMNGIHPDSISGVAYSRILGQIANRTFGRMVRRCTSNPGNAPNRRETNNRPTPTGTHVGNYLPHSEEDPRLVHSEHSIPVS